MYLGVDIGGTKTLVAVLNNDGVIKEEVRLPTPESYEHFKLELRHTLAHFKNSDFKPAGVGITGIIDRKHGRRFAAGKLAWDNIPVQADIERIAHCPAVVENDAKMAGLSEAMLLKESYVKVLYLTISTGIGFALVADRVIDTSIGDRGGTTIMVEHRGKRVPWESFASGRAIVERFGKRAEDIKDARTWQIIARDLAKGLIEVIAITEPEVIVIGGSVGGFFERYEKPLAKELERYKLPLVSLPDLKQAQRPDKAVIYGCYDLAKQVYGHAAVAH